MKQFLTAVFVVFCALPSDSQTLSQETAAVLKSILVKNKDYDLLPTLGGLRYIWIKNNLTARTYIRTNQNSHSDTLKLSNPEKAFVDSSLEAAKSFRWTKENVSEAGLKLKVVSMGIERQGDPQTYAILKPILIRNNSYCFTFYSSFTKQKGYHNLSIWKKTNGKWALWKVIADQKL